MTLPEQFERDRFVEIRGFLEDPLLFVAYRYALLRAESGVAQDRPRDSRVPAPPLVASLPGDGREQLRLEAHDEHGQY